MPDFFIFVFSIGIVHSSHLSFLQVNPILLLHLCLFCRYRPFFTFVFSTCVSHFSSSSPLSFERVLSILLLHLCLFYRYLPIFFCIFVFSTGIFRSSSSPFVFFTGVSHSSSSSPLACLQVFSILLRLCLFYRNLPFFLTFFFSTGIFHSSLRLCFLLESPILLLNLCLFLRCLLFFFTFVFSTGSFSSL